MITFVTSFNKKLFNDYAYRFIESFKNYSGNDCNLLVMYEGDIKDMQGQGVKNIIFKAFDSEFHKKFINLYGNLKEAHGYKIIEVNTAYLGNQFKVIHDFRFDAIRFSFKVFSLIQATEYIQDKSMFAWIDSDVICLKKFSKNDLMQFMPEDNQIMSYLGRKKFPIPNPYSECGFLGFNSNHPFLHKFLYRMKEIYMSGEIFSNIEWHDSWIWDQVRCEFEKEGNIFKNLAKDIPDTHHPFINCNLGKFFDHLKGPDRKKNGKSFDHDYK
jgi:hypothetical protein